MKRGVREGVVESVERVSRIDDEFERLVVSRIEHGDAYRVVVRVHRGDHGVVSPDWGTAFWTTEWLAARLRPHWHLLDFAPGRAEDNQDLYVLRRA